MIDKSRLCVMIEEVTFNKNHTETALSHIRYWYLRTLNPTQFQELWNDCLKNDKRFDDEVLRRAINES